MDGNIKAISVWNPIVGNFNINDVLPARLTILVHQLQRKNIKCICPCFKKTLGNWRRRLTWVSITCECLGPMGWVKLRVNETSRTFSLSFSDLGVHGPWFISENKFENLNLLRETKLDNFWKGGKGNNFEIKYGQNWTELRNWTKWRIWTKCKKWINGRFGQNWKIGQNRKNGQNGINEHNWKNGQMYRFLERWPLLTHTRGYD